MERNFQERLHDFLVAAREPSNPEEDLRDGGHPPEGTTVNPHQRQVFPEVVYPESDQSLRYPLAYNHTVRDQDERMQSYSGQHDPGEPRSRHLLTGPAMPYHQDDMQVFHPQDTGQSRFLFTEPHRGMEGQSYADVDYRHVSGHNVLTDDKYSSSQEREGLKKEDHKKPHTMASGIDKVLQDGKFERDVKEYERLVYEQQAYKEPRPDSQEGLSYLTEEMNSLAKHRKEDDSRVVYDEKIKERYDIAVEASRPVYDQEGRLITSKLDCDRCEELSAVVRCEQCKDDSGLPAIYCTLCHQLLHQGKLRSHTVTALAPPTSTVSVESHLKMDENCTKFPETDRYENLFDRTRTSNSLTRDSGEMSSMQDQRARSPSPISSKVSTQRHNLKDIPDNDSYRSRSPTYSLKKRHTSVSERHSVVNARVSTRSHDRMSPRRFDRSPSPRRSGDHTQRLHSLEYDRISPPAIRSGMSRERSPDQQRYGERHLNPGRGRRLSPLRHRGESSHTRQDGSLRSYRDRSLSPKRHRSRSFSPKRRDRSLSPKQRRSRSPYSRVHRERSPMSARSAVSVRSSRHESYYHTLPPEGVRESHSRRTLPREHYRGRSPSPNLSRRPDRSLSPHQSSHYRSERDRSPVNRGQHGLTETDTWSSIDSVDYDPARPTLSDISDDELLPDFVHSANDQKSAASFTVTRGNLQQSYMSVKYEHSSSVSQVQAPQEQSVSIQQSPMVHGTGLSFLERVLQVVKPPEFIQGQISKRSNAEHAPPSTKQHIRQSSNSQIVYHPFCPLCSEQLGCVQRLPYANMITLKEHVLSVHMPWYVAISQYKVDGSDARRSQLADQLFPPIHHSVSTLKMMAGFFIKLWGKLLHGIVFLLCAKLKLPDPDHLYRHVIEHQLYPDQNIISDMTLVLQDEEKILMNCHQAFVHDGNRLLEISPPNCQSAIFHWITLVNILCHLPKEDQEAFSKFEMYTPENICVLPPETKSMTYNAGTLNKFWACLKKGYVTEVCEFFPVWQTLLNEKTNDENGSGPLQYALSHNRYEVARVLLFFGAKVDERDKKGWTPLCRAAYKGDLEAVKVLLAWNASEQLKKAMHIAKCEGHLPLLSILQGAAVKIKPNKSEESVVSKSVSDKQSVGQSAGAKIIELGESPVRCKLCNKVCSGEDTLKAHVMSKHLPWYIGMTFHKHDASETFLASILMPALLPCIYRNQKPFEYFAKVWGKLAHALLCYLSEQLDLGSPEDLLWYVTQNRLTPDRGTCASEEEQLLMNAHCLFFQGQKKKIEISPPTCLSAVLNYTCLVKILCKLSSKGIEEVPSYQKYTDVDSLQEGILPTGYRQNKGNPRNAESVNQRKFWRSIEDGNILQLWEILVEHSEYKYLYGDDDIDTSPVQCALSCGHLETARFLLFQGATLDRKDIKGFNPLWKAAFKGHVKTIELLLPWETNENKTGAINMAQTEGHGKVVRLIKHSLKKGEDSKEAGQSLAKNKNAEKDQKKIRKSDPSKQAKKESVKKKGAVNTSMPYSGPQGATAMPTYSQGSRPPYPFPAGVPAYCPFPPQLPPPGYPPIMRPLQLGFPPNFPPMPGPGPFWHVPPPGMPPSHAIPSAVYVPPAAALPIAPVRKKLPIAPVKKKLPIAPVKTSSVSATVARRGTNLLSLTESSGPASRLNKMYVPQCKPLDRCPLCDHQGSSDLPAMKAHVLVQHFPWYLGIQYCTNEGFQRSKLCEQILPLVLRCHLDKESLSRQLLGKLCHGFLEFLAEKLSLDKPVDLIDYVKKNYLFSPSDEPITFDDQVLFDCHREFVDNNMVKVTISPPNCVSACLHWSILARIASVFPVVPKFILEAVKVFEKYSVANIIEKKSKVEQMSNLSNVLDTVMSFIKEDNLTGLWIVFDDNPLVSNAMLNDVHGSILIHHAMSLGNIPAACVLMLYGVSVDHQNDAGQTPLLCSASRGDLDQVRCLISWGASEQVQEALETAKLKGPSALYSYLQIVCTSVTIGKEKAPAAKCALKRPVPDQNDPGLIESNKRSKVSGVNTCPICNEDDKNVKVHIFRSHFPWYIGVLWKVYPNKNDRRETRLCSQISRVLHRAVKTRILPPPCFLTIWGKLLEGFVNFLAMLLGFSTPAQLLSYVCENKLWPEANSQMGTIASHDEMIISVYQKTLGVGSFEVGLTPPNHISVLLQWGILTNIMTKIPQSAHNVIIKYEAYTWERHNPILPSGVPRITSSKKVWAPGELLNVEKEIKTAIAKSDISKLCALLDTYLGPFQCKPGGDDFLASLLRGALNNANAKNSARVLLLYGLSPDTKDCHGTTLIHQAIQEGNIKCVEMLLQWGASIFISNKDGQKPYELAMSVGSSSDMCKLLEEARNESFEKSAEQGESTKAPLSKRSTEDEALLQETSEHYKETDGKLDPPKQEDKAEQKDSEVNVVACSPERKGQQRSLDVAWTCPICKERTKEAQLHALVSHLPWYACIAATKDEPITGPRKTPLATKFSKAMAVAVTNKFSYVRPAVDRDGDTPVVDIPVSRFLHLQGYLLNELLVFICEQLSFNKAKDLLRYVVENRLWPGSQAQLLDSDKQTMHAYQTFIGEEKNDLTIGPPNHISALLHWNCLVNILAKLPESVQSTIVSFENFQIKETECIIKTVCTEKGSELTMSVPSVAGVPDGAKADFYLAVSAGNLGWLSQILDDWAVLAYYPVPESGMPGPIWFALSKDQYLVPALLILYGASPNQMDKRGWSPLHSAVEKNDSKAVQILLDLGTCTTLKNPQGMTPLEAAEEKGSDAISTLLKAAESSENISCVKIAQQSYDEEKTETTESDPCGIEKIGKSSEFSIVSSSASSVDVKVKEKLPRGSLVVIKFDKSQAKAKFMRSSHNLPSVSEPRSQLSLATSEPSTQLLISSSEPSSQSGLTSSEPGSQSGLTSSEPGSQSGLTSSEPGSQSGLTSSEPSSQPDLASSEPSTEAKSTTMTCKLGMEITPSSSKSWDCPVCLFHCSDIDSFKKHSALHLPWYLCIGNTQDDLARSPLAQLIMPVINLSVAKYTLPPCRFTRVWGELLCNFLKFLCSHLKLSNFSMLREYIVKNTLYDTNPPSITNAEKLTMNAYLSYRGMTEKELTVSPPNHESAILHWTCMVKLIAKLPAEISKKCITFEQFVLKKIGYKFVKIPKGEKTKDEHFKMTKPELSAGRLAKWAELGNIIKSGNLQEMCQLCDKLPLSVCLPCAGMNSCGMIYYAMYWGQPEMAIAAYLYGACVDHLDRAGKTPLHALICGRKNYEREIKILLWMGASVGAQWRGMTPYQLAQARGKGDVLNLLSHRN